MGHKKRVMTDAKSPRVFLKSAALVACLIVIQVFVLPIDLLAHLGCNKYVPLAAVEELMIFVWQVGAVSLIVNLAVLLLFLSDFLRQPKRVVQNWSLVTIGCFVIWRGLAIAQSVKHASKSDEARDFVYPLKLTWVPANLLFFLCMVAWFLLLVSAVAALASQSDRAQRA